MLRLSNLAVAAVASAFFFALIACGDSKEPGFDFDDDQPKAHSCVYLSKQSTHCDGTNIDGDFEKKCSETTCDVVSSDSVDTGTCVSNFLVQDAYDFDGTCQEALAASSSSSSGSTPTPTPTPTPSTPKPGDGTASCNAFVDRLCARAHECVPTGDEAGCASDAKTQHDCANAVGVTSGYATCMSDVGAMACTATALPTSCNGVVLKE